MHTNDRFSLLPARPTESEIRTLSPRVLADTAKRSITFDGFSPREMQIYLAGVEDGMEAKASACHQAMSEFIDAMQQAPTTIPVT